MSVVELDISTSAECLFRRVGGERGAFWLDGEATGRSSFMSFAPEAQLVLRPTGELLLSQRGEIREASGDPLSAIESFVAAARPLPTLPAAPRTIGFLAYDLAGWIEPRIAPRRGPDATLPLAYLARYDAIIEVAPRGHDRPATGVRVHAATRESAERHAARLVSVRSEPARASASPVMIEPPRADLHVAAVERALAYIAAGDVYQVNLAQRFRVRSAEPPPEVYLRLRAAQPVPFATYLDGGDFAVLCNSPERFVRVQGSTIETEPIKGTRPRDADPLHDASLRGELLADPKERAEHVMIVDLERNDLGRLCVPGSIHVPSLLRVESFATVHHMVSTVRGRLRDDVGVAALLRATFPGGSITGAPKIRAAQVIAKLERVPREIYTGALVFFRGPRDLDSAIAIRTAVARGGTYTYHAGGGIVADSDPLREHEECVLKARPFLRALGLDEGGLGVAAGAPPVTADEPRAAGAGGRK